MKAIFSKTIVTSPPKLEELAVKDCHKLEEIISLDSDEAGQLKNLFVPSEQVYFPKLASISIERCSKFKRMFSVFIVKVLPMLEQLVVKDCDEWEKIISLDSEEASELRNVSAPSHQICFPRLRKIEIEGCNRLKEIFSSTIVTRLTMLEQLFVKDCSEWDEIISWDSQEARQLRNQFVPFQQVCFPKLRTIDIKGCNKLKAIFSATIVTRLPRLEHLIVTDCNEWEEIISLDSMGVRQLRNLDDPSQQSCFPMLQRIVIKKCNKLKKNLLHNHCYKPTRVGSSIYIWLRWMARNNFSRFRGSKKTKKSICTFPTSLCPQIGNYSYWKLQQTKNSIFRNSCYQPAQVT